VLSIPMPTPWIIVNAATGRSVMRALWKHRRGASANRARNKQERLIQQRQRQTPFPLTAPRPRKNNHGTRECLNNRCRGGHMLRGSTAEGWAESTLCLRPGSRHFSARGNFSTWSPSQEAIAAHCFTGSFGPWWEWREASRGRFCSLFTRQQWFS
jgi:hypothetical protein